ncbi:putative short-chain dehydrogenases reductases (SDR) family protein [Lyophyllum shimeji]|uniref:Short-chain dehydrogenases reductases (SDR) family protein n=1 Tax=Lyophyllum shimeji TaxID=47721 RepID=A0A9P3US37_LYOSH|nr:putative short-chain dehydrogenases reductases (SDR) family protein [Lyophyllum shimeji]
MKIENRTFIVSGGSSGLGMATVQDLLTSNAFIAILDRSPPPEDANLPSSRVKFLQTDITDLSQIQAAVDATVAWTAETRAPLGGVINCAGVGTAAKIIDAHNNPHSLDLWDFTLSVNLTGSFNLTRLALPHLIKVEPEDTPDGERGVVVFVSSAAAFEGQPGQSAYSATKGALRSMTLPMARDLARHAIRVVTIAPGVFASNMTANFPGKTRKSLENDGVVYPRRFGHPTEFARTVEWGGEVACEALGVKVYSSGGANVLLFRAVRR